MDRPLENIGARHYLAASFKYFSGGFLVGTPWRLATFLVTSLLMAPALFAAVDVRPSHPPFTSDTILAGTKPTGELRTLAEFFDDRLKDTECRDSLDSYLKKLNDKESSLKKLVLDKAQTAVIDEAERLTDLARGEYLSKVDRCGMCATRTVEKRRIVTPKSTETWYISDGSCYLDPVKFGAKAYDRIVAKLAKVDAYPAYSGGLRNILEFMPVDSVKGDLHPEWTAFDRIPQFFVFIAVKGPQILGETLSMQYVIQNDLFEKSDAGGKYWGLRFQNVRPPRDFQAPEVLVHKASGSKIARAFTLNSVIGQWHVDTRGFLRYYTAADFGTAIPFAASMAKSVLIDTLAHVYEQGTEEKP